MGHSFYNAPVNRVQTKYVAADATDGDLSELTFSNLIVGKFYEVKGQLYATLDSGVADAFVSVTATHNSATVGYFAFQVGESSDTTADIVTMTPNFIFQAAASTLTFAVGSASANSFISGDGTKAESYVQLIERNDLIETSAW